MAPVSASSAAALALAMALLAGAPTVAEAGNSCSATGDAYQGGGHRRRRRWQSCPEHSSCLVFADGCACDFGYVCKSNCDAAVGRECEACANMDLTGVETTDTQFEPDEDAGAVLLTAVVNNTSSGSTATFSGTFSQTVSTSDTVTSMKSETTSKSFSGKVTFKEPWILSYLTGGAKGDVEFTGSYTVSGTRSVSKTSETTSSVSVDSSCGVTVPAGNCVKVTTSMMKGTVNAQFTATATCPAYSESTPDAVSTIESTFQVDDVYAQATYSTCSISDCSTGLTLNTEQLTAKGIVFTSPQGRRLGKTPGASGALGNRPPLRI